MIVVSTQAFPPAQGGVQNLLAGTAEYIARSGREVLVLADGGSAARRYDTLSGAPYAVRRFDGPRPLRRLVKAREVTKLARRGAIDALYLDSWKSLELLPANLGCPVIVWAHGNEFPLAGRKVRRIRHALAKATCILPVSEDTRTRIGDAMPDGVDARVTHPPVLPAAEPTAADLARAEEVWGDASPRLVSLCRLIELKGIDTAIRAMPAILERHPRARFAIVGGGEDRARLEGIARKLRLGDRVVFLGWVGGGDPATEGVKTALLRTADLLLQPGRRIGAEREGYGISYIEAAMQGLPSISGDQGGAPEAILHGETGLVVDATSAERVAEAALSILDDPDRLARMRDAARTHGEAALWENRIGGILAMAGL